MPLGLFLSKWDPTTGISVYAKEAISGTDLSNEQANTILLSHAGGDKPVEKIALHLGTLSVASKFMERKFGNSVQRLILTMVLAKGERPENFYPALDSLEESIWDNINKPQLKMNIVLKEAFANVTAHVVSDIDAEVIRKRVIKRAQDLLDASQIDRAQRLLSNSKTIPDRLQEAATNGMKLRTQQKYDESTKAYEEAKRCAAVLDEPELVDEFDKQAKRSTEIPLLEKAREKAIKIAREHVRKEEFLQAANKYREAAELSEKLDDIVGKEINQKKYEILNQFSEIENMG